MEKKIFKYFSFGCQGNQSSQGIGFVLAILKEDVIRNICANFDHFLISGFRKEVKLDDGRHTTHDDGRQTEDHPKSSPWHFVPGELKTDITAIHLSN